MQISVDSSTVIGYDVVENKEDNFVSWDGMYELKYSDKEWRSGITLGWHVVNSSTDRLLLVFENEKDSFSNGVKMIKNPEVCNEYESCNMSDIGVFEYLCELLEKVGIQLK